ncbi:MAG: TIM barrel protein [Cytophagales bacterium]|nr:TIM barrel protein [Cytophagales bacterium]
MHQDVTRRDFLRTAGLGVAGLHLPAPAAAPEPQVKKKKVELAIATITCDGFGDENFEQAFALIPKLPYTNVEFNCWYGRNLTPAGIASIRQRCGQHKLKPICVQGSAFGASGNNIVKDVTHKLWNLEAARQLGCRRVKFTGAGRGTEGGLETVIAVLREITPAAEDLDLLILVENHAGNNIENIEDYDRIFSAIPSAHVGMCMDNAHFDGANVDLMAVVDRFHSRILHIDLKETERKGIHKVVPFGQGVTDNAAVVKKMLGHGYQGYLVVEMSLNDQPPAVKEAELRKAHQLFARYER